MDLEKERQQVASLQKLLEQRDAYIHNLESRIADLEAERESLYKQAAEGMKKGWQLEDLQRMLFGRRSERFVSANSANADTTQLTLGKGFEPSAEEVAVPAGTTAIGTTASEVVKVPTSRKNKRHVAHHGRNALSPLFPRVEQVHMPQGDMTGYRKIGEVVSERYEYEPGKIYVLRDIRPQFQKMGGEGVIVAPMPSYIIEKGITGPGLLAHMHVEKYTYHMPYYRQLQRFERAGVCLAASTVNDGEVLCASYLKLLYELMQKEMLHSSYLQCDETTIRVCNDIGKGKAHKGYYWVVYAPDEKLVLFQYHHGRGQEVPRKMLQGFKGHLQTDAYASYYAVFKDDPRVTLMCCLVHARRKFEKALKHDAVRATYILEEIKILYALERRAKEENLDAAHILALRSQQAVPVLERIKAWLDEHISLTVPSTPIYEAISYTLKIWDRLMVYTIDGRLLPDTNLVENALRPVTLGRKNYMFAGNEEGAQRGAMYYSLLETCKKNNIDPYTWLKDFYTRIPTHPINRLREFLPSVWKQLREESQTKPANL
ncbi:MAG: IS66 family transposase [Segetibacter sp.]